MSYIEHTTNFTQTTFTKNELLQVLNTELNNVRVLRKVESEPGVRMCQAREDQLIALIDRFSQSSK